MTYLAWIHRAQGVMFFEDDRPGGDGKGKSWGNAGALAECERLGVEGAELTAALSSSTDNTNVVAVSVSDRRVEAAAFVEAGRQAVGGGIVVLVANTANEPMPFTLRISPSSVADGPAAVLFAARNVSVRDGVLRDWVDAMGTRAYRLRPSTATEPTISPNRNNLLFNPSFERSGGGVGGAAPDGIWASVEGDSAAAVFSEPRDSVHGLHSLRIHTPTEGQGLLFSHAMCPVSMIPDTEYEVSVWARGKSFAATAAHGPTFRLGLLGYGISFDGRDYLSLKSFTLNDTWTRYTMTVKPPDLGGKKQGCYREYKVAWQLETAGVMFLDLLELVQANLTSAVEQQDIVAAVELDTRAVSTPGTATHSHGRAPVQDSLGLPLSPMGFFSHQQDTVPISTHRAGMSSGYRILPRGNQRNGAYRNITAVQAWLDRCDAVGVNVLLDLRYDATIFGHSHPSPSQVAAALEVTKANVAALMHHDSIFGWYIAGALPLIVLSVAD